MNKKLVVSIVTHNHGDIVVKLIDKIISFDLVDKIILTINSDEDIKLCPSDKLHIIRNLSPKGFSENHNYAFKIFKSDYYCVLNPDVILLDNPFPILVDAFKDSNIVICAPLVCNSIGLVEDSARYFPTLTRTFLKVFLGIKSKYPISKNYCFTPDWVAGMFMIFDSNFFLNNSGFDENFYLYYEDADICKRVSLAGFKVLVDTRVVIIHDAQRTSHKNLKYFLWHIQSLIRYLLKYNLFIVKK